MASRQRVVTGGVDTHSDTHYAVPLDQLGRRLGGQQFPACEAGYQDLLTWLRSFGRVVSVGVEGTGSYGAGLARFLTAQGVAVIEVDRPDRRNRRRKGKSDPVDAEAAARAVQSGTATGAPKTRTGPVEAIRVTRVVRDSAVKARTAAINQLHSLIVTAPESIRAAVRSLSPARKLAHCLDFAVDDTRLHDPAEATKAALRGLAYRITSFTAEIKQADKQLKALVIYGVGPDVAGQLLSTAGDNPTRLHSERGLAALCGVSPVPASSGKTTDRHRLNRGGDRAANRALYIIVLTRLAKDPRTRAYADRRTKQGRTTKEIIRCLKRYVVREIYEALIADHNALTP